MERHVMNVMIWKDMNDMERHAMNVMIWKDM